MPSPFGHKVLPSGVNQTYTFAIALPMNLPFPAPRTQ